MVSASKLSIVAFVLSAVSGQGLAHHGVAGVGAAGLQGPGAPIEAATSTNLPKDKFFAYLKLDQAQYKTFDSNPANPESKYANYWISGVGYGFKPWFSGYLFAPYYEKVDEPGGFTTRGFTDISLYGQLGFKYDGGLRLTQENESLDDLEDWHFTIFGGSSLPTGNPNLKDQNGNIDPGKSTGFGKPAFNVGLTATKEITPRTTINLELSHLRFQTYTYEDGNSLRFGSEYRANTSVAYRLYTDFDRRFRVDTVLEGQYLYLARDITNGMGDLATGGEIYYLLPGLRIYWGTVTAAIGVKKPIWSNLNEASEQQGAEGKEKYRLIMSVSVLF